MTLRKSTRAFAHQMGTDEQFRSPLPSWLGFFRLVAPDQLSGIGFASASAMQRRDREEPGAAGARARVESA
jgi:hypothetical protein